jgi:hypothetical protein
MTHFRHPWLIVGLALALSVSAAQADLPRQSAVPGGVVLIDIPGTAIRGTAPPAVSFEGKRVMVLPKGEGWVAVVGIPLARSPGAAQVEIRQGAAPLTRGFTIEGKAYATQSLKVAPRQVDLAPEDAERVARESPILRQAMDTFTETPPRAARAGTAFELLRAAARVQRPVPQPALRDGHRRTDRHAGDRARAGTRGRDRGFLLQRQHRDRRPRAGLGDALLPPQPHRRGAG